MVKKNVVSEDECAQKMDIHFCYSLNELVNSEQLFVSEWPLRARIMRFTSTTITLEILFLLLINLEYNLYQK